MGLSRGQSFRVNWELDNVFALRNGGAAWTPTVVHIYKDELRFLSLRINLVSYPRRLLRPACQQITSRMSFQNGPSTIPGYRIWSVEPRAVFRCPAHN